MSLHGVPIILKGTVIVLDKNNKSMNILYMIKLNFIKSQRQVMKQFLNPKINI